MTTSLLPKTIFVKVEHDGNATWLIAGETLEEISSGDVGSEKCGKYQLIETGVITTEVRFDKIRHLPRTL